MSAKIRNQQLGCIASRISLTKLICLTILLEPKLFTKIPVINFLYITGAVMVFCMVAMRFMRNHIKVDKLLVFALIYRLSMLPQTLLRGGEILDWGYYTLTLLALVGYYETLKDDKERLEVIDNVAFLILFYLIINLLVLLAYPGGLFEGLFFLGYRTRIVEVFITGIVASAYIDCKQQGSSFRTWAICLIGLIQIIKLWVATALVGLGALILSYVVLSRLPSFCKPSMFRVITCFGFVLTIAFCFFNANLIFSDFIQIVLHKSASLSDRTAIWAIAIEMIEASPLFGYGIVDNGNHILWVTSWSSMYWQAHNTILQILLDGGLIGLFSYIALLFHVSSQLKRAQITGKLLAVFLSAWIALNIMSISEIFVLQNYYFLFFLLVLAACADSELNRGCHLGV